MKHAGRLLLDARALDRTLRRLALQILEGDPLADLALVGVRTRGVPLAHRLAALLAQEGLTVPVGELDIALYRDDTRSGRALPEVRPTRLPFSVDGQAIVLVDDVLFTGRTTRAALDALMAWGRPRVVRLAVLVDRGHRELPLHADHVGLAVETTRAQTVAVRLAEADGIDGVWLEGA